MAEMAEPGRTQWTKYCTDADQVAHVSNELRLKMLSPEERKKNPVSQTL
ncbi:hypothetical protein PF005_g14655 [Phytophthora fragariae]|uniref:Uncharacterized protein n=1 Tax=Phytophthora fragariae TaxID=53985 RepID=A0A6A3EAA5_9STRA|nr:hypothetical protein PF003_g13691 [Phytophthora fragariae]KAE8930475.1 hypothetical protein PF009_g19438 [Phytophthora fragariae]KAE9024240.1 hypothetical protein PF011_g3607 [Phytophthora fragariae]KAE9202220.1 hypothetical protein PF005_g14655 [Phytophthora fragariae]KAE9214241.1 hypothetical protein PF004_g15102 [Phytophthora fragariae]